MSLFLEKKTKRLKFGFAIANLGMQIFEIIGFAQVMYIVF